MMELYDSYNELKRALAEIKKNGNSSVRIYLSEDWELGNRYPILDISKYLPNLMDQVEKELKEIASDTRQSIKHLMDEEERRAKEEEDNGTETD